MLSGMVLVVGFERTKTYYEIIQDNRDSGRALAWAGFVVFVHGFLATLITKLPVIGRLYKWFPTIKNIVEIQTDDALWAIARYASLICATCPCGC